MSILTQQVAYPKTKIGTFFLALILSVVVPIFSHILYLGLKFFDGSQPQCGLIGGGGPCTLIDSIFEFTIGYLFFGTLMTFGLNIIVPTLLMWIFLDYFRWRHS